jgi:sporulation protein YlmC with PRC-barrel domain
VKTTHLHGLPAINVLDGSKVGDVERAYLDPAERRIVGFSIRTGGGFMKPEGGLLADSVEVQALGDAALTLLNNSPQGSETTARYDELIDLGALHGREVFTDGGTFLGHVADSELDERTFVVSTIDVAPSRMGSNQEIQIGRVVTIGAEVVVVRDETVLVATGSVAC